MVAEGSKLEADKERTFCQQLRLVTITPLTNRSASQHVDHRRSRALSCGCCHLPADRASPLTFLPSVRPQVPSATPPIVLHRYATNPNCYCGSVWSNRLDSLLTFSSAPFTYSTSTASNQKSPSGRIPYMFIGDELLTDSLFAYQEVVKRGLAKDLDAGLNDKENGLTRMIAATVRELNYCLEKER
jgi:hypothetical protein